MIEGPSYWVVTVSLLFLIFRTPVNVSSLLLSPCDSDAECFPVRANCLKVAETCPRGICACVAPFVATPSGHCRRGITPWRRCNIHAGDVCVGKNFQCIDGQCQCRPGLFPVGDSCVQMAQVVASLGSTCSDDSNCLPGMECRPWVSSNGNGKSEQMAVTICQCPITHRVLNNTQCVPRRLGDPCSGSDADCGLILDAICSPETSTCACPSSHQAAQTLHNMAPLPIADGFTTSWQLVDACRPINGAVKRVGQRCTNSLQCQYGHMCARCEPKNLNLPKTCNRPSCSSHMCRNQTCPLCTHYYYTRETSTAPPVIVYHHITTPTIPTTTTTVLSSTTLTPVPQGPEPFQERDQEAELEHLPDIPSTLPEIVTSSTNKPIERAQVQPGPNVALAVTLPLLFLVIALIGIGIFLRYAWGRLNWRRRAIKCVEALETASSSASSGLSMNRHHYGSVTGDPNSNVISSGISEVPNLPNVSFYGGTGGTSECAYTQASATMLIRELEEELESGVGNNIGTANSNINANNNNNNTTYSALTLNYNSSNLVNLRNKQHMMSRSMYHIQQLPMSSSRSDLTACSRHKYCFNTSNTMEDMMDDSDYVSGNDMPPRLPCRSKSIRSYAPVYNNNNSNNNSNSNDNQWGTGVGSNFVSSRLDIDRRKSLQY